MPILLENLKKLICDTAANAGIQVPDLRFPLILRSGINQEGRSVRFYLNFSGESQAAVCSDGGTELLTEKQIHKLQEIQIEPWGLAVIES
ncbi:MAG TPA: hypothetical protein DCG37_00310 [Lachnospiraceae bacterium]|nr:hypothetical protein [Lachnospiraceae bacterium]